MKKLDNVKILNDGNPIEIGKSDGHIFTVSPTTAKKRRAYYTDKLVALTTYEENMPGVVVAQNRGMMFSSSRPIDKELPTLRNINLIVVPEISRTLKPTDDENNKIIWVGNGPHEVKDVCGDGQFQHWLDHELWFKLAKFLYGGKGMGQPGLATDVGRKVKDIWGVERTITDGNTILMNSSVIKGVSSYGSLEELIEHSEMWGLITLMKQWQTGDHKPEKKRVMGVQPMTTNLQISKEEIAELEKPEARKIFASKSKKVSWMTLSNVNTSRGRAYAARPDLIDKDLVIAQIDMRAGNQFRKIAQGKVMCEGQYLKMFQDKLAFSLVYVHGMDMNEAAKKAAATGLHGELRVNPSFAGKHYEKDEEGNTILCFSKKTKIDGKGRYVEATLVRYPHGGPSETIIVKLYLDETVPKDVIIFPLPVANEDGTIPVKFLYAMRLQGADFDGDATTAYTEETWLESQRRNEGKSYMGIPVNTNSTEKDKTKVTTETWEQFCTMKADSLTNEVGLIATSMKYFMCQYAMDLRYGNNASRNMMIIAKHACAMGDDIDEFKHGKATRDFELFSVPKENGRSETLYAPYFVRYTKKFRTKESFDKSVYTKNGIEKHPGAGILDMCAVVAEELMKKSGIDVVYEESATSDGTPRYYYTVHPVTWQAKDVDLFLFGNGTSQKLVTLPEELEEAYNVEHGMLFSARTLFQMLYKDHAATAKALMNGYSVEENRDDAIKAITKIDERYALAKIAVVAWTKRMVLEKENRMIDAKEAMKLFTTMIIQHTKNARSALEVMTQTGTYRRADGSTYEKTVFDAQRPFNYFLDVCGDGLFMLGQTNPDFPDVSPKIVEAAEVSEPDMAKAEKNIEKEMELLEKLSSMIPYGIDKVLEEIDEQELDRINANECLWNNDDHILEELDF